MDTINGTIEHITFTNPSNGYTVAVLKNDDGAFTVVGNMPFLNEGDGVELRGSFTSHPVYGEQFKVDYCERMAPEGAAAILTYLSSGAIKGVGPATARLIVERFGEESLEIISKQPETLACIKGISLQKARQIGEEYAKQFSVRDIMLYLSKFKITPEEALKIFKVLGENTISALEKNPYILCDDEIGFSFIRAEEIASFFPGARESDYRTTAGIIFVLKHNLNNGHTCLPKDKLLNTSRLMLGIPEEQCAEVCDALCASLKLRSEILDGESFIFLPDYYASEEFCAARISVLLKNPPPKQFAADIEIDFVEKSDGIKYEPLQKQAIKSSIENGIMVLTGGPGTGKTTTLNAIIKILENKKLDIALCAPTGRAAKRMSELTGHEAKTIHRLLEVEWNEDDKQTFARNEKNPLDCDVLIVDEMSMVDIKLFESLLRAIRIGCRIILVGDADQLPSVGAGNVLHDILLSGAVPSICLKRVFRQAMESLIIANAHAIICGDRPVLNDKKSDFFMLEENNPTAAAELIRSLCTERLPAAYGFSPKNNIQVLCPSKMMELGSVNINNILQDRLNPPGKNKKQLHFKGGCLREGDKVMQIKNNYDILWTCDSGETGSGVFNGDVGVLEKIDLFNGIFYIRFDDRLATYYSEHLKEIELAYAMTIHKSQGSEFECVVIPLLDAPKKLLYRNLLYTAVTRAKKILIIVGSSSTVISMVNNNRKTLRYTSLKNKLEEINRVSEAD